LNVETQKDTNRFVEDRLGPPFLVGLFFLCLIFASSSATAHFAEARRRWLLLERDNRGNKEIVTVLDSLPAEDIRIKYPQILSITWGYRPLPNWLPAEQEITWSRLLYSALDRILGQDGYYAISRTGSGSRTMY
jgi:hypothetical protein|tara:strand:+ start:2207 stop:2608 length:402 start_codon:yes stop_codon:yes gene_type:complete